jgi:hypothetical protein
MYDMGMFEALADMVEDLRVPVDGDALAELYGIRDRLDAVLADATVAFDDAELWELDGATSLTAWLRDRAGMTSGRAGHVVGVTRRIRCLPVTLQVWRDGGLSSGQVDAVMANVKPALVGLFAEHEADLVVDLASLTTAETMVAMQRWRERAEALVDDKEPVERKRSLHHSDGLDGRGVLSGHFDPDSNEVIKSALRLAESPDVEGEPARTPAERRADSLVDVCRHFLDHQHTKPGGRHRPHLNMIIDVDDELSGRYVNGAAMARELIDAYLCEGALHRVLRKGRSVILDMGVSTRVVTAALFVALVARDEHCRFPGCDRKASWCEGHHVVWFTHGGPTRLDNLVLLCSRHHHLLHKPGWQAKLLPDATFEVAYPDGRVRTSHPRAHAEAFW